VVTLEPVGGDWADRVATLDAMIGADAR
jgi:hypothetical protein